MLNQFMDYLKIEDWTLYDEGLSFGLSHLDFRKAFKKLPHGRLICKLQKYSIVGKLNIWMNDFFFWVERCLSV